MLAERFVYLNGDFIPWNQANVHLMSHSLGRGTAIFEIFGFNETSTGPAIFRLDEHIERLFQSAAFVAMTLSLSRQALQEAVMATVKKNNFNRGMIKIIGFYSQAAFEITPPNQSLDVAIFVFYPEQDFGALKKPFDRGTTLCISRWRKIDPQTVPIGAKVAANYLNGMMSELDARERSFESAVMLDTQGFIAEGAVDSIFLVKDGRLMTSSLGTVLGSISRKSVLQAAEVIGIDRYEGRLPPSLLYDAEEIFTSSTSHKVLPVRQIEDRKLNEIPGPLSCKLKDLMDEIVSGHDERFKDWLFPIV